MNNFYIILWTAKDLDEAKEIVKLLLKNKLIACATLLDKAYSMYIWEGKIQAEAEVQVIIKSLKSNFLKIKKAIQANSSYEVPEILAINVQDGLDSYLSWIKKTTA